MSCHDYHNIQFDDRYSAFIQRTQRVSPERPWLVTVSDHLTELELSFLFHVEGQALAFAQGVVELLRDVDKGMTA